MGKTKIEWADYTFNPWIGCTKVSPACDHCYAETWATNKHLSLWGAGVPRRRSVASTWQQPLNWNRQSLANLKAGKGNGPLGENRNLRVFCASLADVFDYEIPTQWRTDLFDLIDRTRGLTWMLLTKRRIRPEFLPWGKGVPWPHVWLGVTVEDQQRANERIPMLLETAAAKRFISVEPMLTKVDLTRLDAGGVTGRYAHGVTYNSLQSSLIRAAKLDWVICGGETGNGARPMAWHWADHLQRQCETNGTPFLFKQWGDWIPASQTDDPIARIAEWSEPMVDIGGDPSDWDPHVLSLRWGKRRMVNVGVHNVLNGREYLQFPDTYRKAAA
ncbi:MAG: phage Gp37/Gp68 family protein [Synechococcaceae cyanobacterium SM1_2_3]|nr:phage Gp37/Gp68 family protein [Synechococcaceae cyanobacterium SM1_2_3]